MMEEIVKEIEEELQENMQEDIEDDVVRGSDQRENVIEWYNGSERMTVTLSQRRFINKIKRYAGRFPNEVEIVRENADGTLLAHVPLRFLDVRPPREVSEEQREKFRENMKKYREGKKANDGTEETIH